MKVCDCYRQLKPIPLKAGEWLMVGECLGAKNKPRVDCCGDESHCLFYSDRRKAKAVTNADRIRNMTDEELAEFLNCHNFCARNFDCEKGKRPCKECNLDWLKQEAEEGE